MKTMKWVLIAALLASIVVPTCMIMRSIPLFDCKEDLLTALESPDHRYIAEVYARNCGATTSYVSHVNLRNSISPAKLNPSGTVTEGMVFQATGRLNIRLSWQTNSHLQIKHDPGMNLVFHDTWNGITISHHEEK